MIQIVAFIISLLCLSACGKKGPVEPLEESEYPRTYPKPPPSDLSPLQDKQKKKRKADA